MYAPARPLYIQRAVLMLSLAMEPHCQFSESDLFYLQPEVFRDFHQISTAKTKLDATQSHHD